MTTIEHMTISGGKATWPCPGCGKENSATYDAAFEEAIIEDDANLLCDSCREVVDAPVVEIQELNINYPQGAVENATVEEIVPFVPERGDQLPAVIKGDEAWMKCIAVVKVPADSITLTLYLDEHPEKVTDERVIAGLKWLEEHEDKDEGDDDDREVVYGPLKNYQEDRGGLHDQETVRATFLQGFGPLEVGGSPPPTDSSKFEQVATCKCGWQDRVTMPKFLSSVEINCPKCGETIRLKDYEEYHRFIEDMNDKVRDDMLKVHGVDPDAPVLDGKPPLRFEMQMPDGEQIPFEKGVEATEKIEAPDYERLEMMRRAGEKEAQDAFCADVAEPFREVQDAEALEENDDGMDEG